MEARAYLRNARIAPRKVQIVLDLIRNKPLILHWRHWTSPRRLHARCWQKLLKSAIANAENNHNMDKDNLYVAECLRNTWPDP